MSHRRVVLPALWLTLACSGPGGAPVPVRPGIDVLATDSLHLVADRRVGLLTNQTGVDRNGVGDVERLIAASVNLTALFSPEHGFRGVLDQPNVGHGVDSATSLPIYSLYGDVRAPTPAMLQSIDVLVVDLQDIGARTYTYISTAILAMRSARAAGIPVLVLDRPNPIGGILVQGPVLDPAFASFVGMLEVPLRHGMTFGELALFGNRTLSIDADLTVIPVAGWIRETWFDETGLPWIRPSPNMPNLESATHYPGLVVFEATNLSVGRGTPAAFQLLGSPWLDPAAVIQAASPVPGVSIADTTMTPVDPSDGKYDGMTLPALRFLVTDRESYDPTHVMVSVLAALRDVHGDSLQFRADGFDRLAGGDGIRRAIVGGESAPEIWSRWYEPLERFEARRREFMLYPLEGSNGGTLP